MKVYLDCCCYNRPYDDQTQIRISLETQAKLIIQHLIKDRTIQLVSSFVLDYENSKHSDPVTRDAIRKFIVDNEIEFVSVDSKEEVKRIAATINANGIKPEDSAHIACAIYSKCDYFITTDDRILKYTDNRISIVSPIEFVMEIE